jgi:hypothetical protein
MKKNLISLAVAASVLGGAAVQAGQYVNPDNTGQVLLFPFYNADNGNSTNMHIANTTGKAKAVKIRFVEYKNSDEVLDFNLYLSPWDHFAFGVMKDPNGTGAAITTRDNSCTVPALGSANAPYSGVTTANADGSTTRTQPFVNYAYATDADATIERTLTGHVEVIEMGVLVNVGTATTTQWADFAKHGATGVPANCAGIVAGFPTAFAADPGVTAQEGGLYGIAYHIDVEAATAFGFEATAVDDWATGTGDHTDPGSLLPSLASGTPLATIHTSSGATQYTQITAPNSSQAISAVLMTESLSNDVMVNSALGGMTDWVVTFPTKRLHVDAATAIAPFTKTWTGPTTEVKACETISLTQYDREEQTFVAVTTSDLQFSPLPPAAPAATPASICNEVAVVAMGPTGTASALNVTTGKSTIASTYTEGWQRMAFGGATPTSMTIGGYKMTGLPAVGFGAYKLNNGAMSYGHTTEHKRSSNNVVSS